MSEVWVYKKLGRLFAADADGEEVLAGIADGELVRAKILKPRNGKQHRLFWALMKLVADNSDHFETPAQVVFALKIKLGHCDLLKLGDGRVVPMPRSISYSKMDQTEFAAFFNSCVDTICQSKWLQALPADIKAEAELMMGINYHAPNPRSHKKAAA